MKKITISIFASLLLMSTLSGCTGNKPIQPSSLHEHNLGSLIPENPPTCTEDGLKAHYVCSDCGQFFDADRNETTEQALSINKLGHNPDTIWHEGDGCHFHICERCHEHVDIAEHTLRKVEAIEASHTHGGNLEHYVCDVCEMSFLDSKGKVLLTHTDVAPSGHDKELTYHPAVPATCVEDGVEEYYSCSCGALFKDVKGLISLQNPIKINKLGHISYGIYKSDDTRHWHTCYRCGETIDQENHTPGVEVHSDLHNEWKECTKCGHKVNIEEREITGCHHDRLVHYEKLNPTLIKPGHIEYYCCFDCHNSYYDTACLSEIPNTQYGVANKLDGRYLSPLTGNFSLLNSNLRTYMSAQTDKEIVSALQNISPVNDQAKKTVNWTDNGYGPFTLEISHTRDFEQFESVVTSSTSYTFDGVMLPGETYYYRVKDTNNNFVIDDLSFRVDNTYSLRNMRVEGVTNMRDIGGWRTIDGHTVKYGKVYRGGTLASITAHGKETFLATMGVKTEIDLRRDGESELIDNRLNYQKCDIWGYTQIIPGFSIYTEDTFEKRPFDELSMPSLKKGFEILADSNNYPVYFHCAAGADRTGTFAYLINGLLGVPYEDLARDFELTTFSVHGNRYRSGVTEDGEFDDSGLYANTSTSWCGFGKMHEVICLFYGEEEQPLSKTIENYLKTACGISQETIDAVRNNLLD